LGKLAELSGGARGTAFLTKALFEKKQRNPVEIRGQVRKCCRE